MRWFLEKFPEDLFPCTDADYTSKVIQGSVIARQRRLTVAGLARDCEKELYWNIHRLDALAGFFKDFKVFVYENDSEDRTPELLEQWSRKDPRVTFLSERTGKIRHEQTKEFARTVDMAYYRNKYVPFILGNSGDYVIVYDFDLKGGFSYEGIFNSLYHMENDNIDVVASNGLYFNDDNRRLYFDAWASRGDIFGDNANELTLERGQSPLEVESAGGGLILYRREAWEDWMEYKAGDCDHPTLHKQMRYKGRRIFLNPSQITLYNKTRYCL